MPVIEGLVKSALFHPLQQFRNSALSRLQKASELGKNEGIGQILAGFVHGGEVYIRLENVSGKIEDRYLFDVPAKIYEVENPVSYPFVISECSISKSNPYNGNSA